MDKEKFWEDIRKKERELEEKLEEIEKLFKDGYFLKIRAENEQRLEEKLKKLQGSKKLKGGKKNE